MRKLTAALGIATLAGILAATPSTGHEQSQAPNSITIEGEVVGEGFSDGVGGFFTEQSARHVFSVITEDGRMYSFVTKGQSDAARIDSIIDEGDKVKIHATPTTNRYLNKTEIYFSDEEYNRYSSSYSHLLELNGRPIRTEANESHFK